MSNDPKNEKFKKWLDILQQESWQLELIISGFAIYGLFLALDPIKVAAAEIQQETNILAIFIFSALSASWFTLTMNLLIHVVLRGLWIAAIGLRYVSGDIDYEALNYSPKFTRNLKKRVGSFDDYVAKLEKYCSVIFAVTFILVFYLLGTYLILFLMTLLGIWMGDNEPGSLAFWVSIPLLVFLAFGMLLTFIDFVTQGWLKRKKWTTKIYYPFYWVFKFLTLSFLYRPMIYNFLDIKFGRRLSYLIVPIYIAILLLTGIGYSTSNYIDADINSSALVANRKNYNNLIEKKEDFVFLASIPDKVITDPYLQVFVDYGGNVEDDVFYFNKALKPENDKRGLHSPFTKGMVDERVRDSLLSTYVSTLEEMYQFRVDSTLYETHLVLTSNKRNQKGYESVLDLKGMARGKHMLEIKRKTHLADSVYHKKIISIPFWYYPE